MERELKKGSSETPYDNDDSEGSDEDSSFSFKKQLQDLCPFYMSIGMSYSDYWDGEVDMAKYYRDAWELRQEEKNRELWLQGLYIYEALVDASPVFRDFVKSGTKPHKYTEEPYAVTQKQIQKKKEREMRMRYDRIKAHALAWVASEEGKGGIENGKEEE